MSGALLHLVRNLAVKLMDSFKGADGEFGKPEYTIPDPDDGEVEEEGAAA